MKQGRLFSVKLETKMTTTYQDFTTFKLEGEVTSLSESSMGKVEDNREKWGDFCEKLIVINQSVVLSPL
jgi:hypothetical protein